MKKSFRLGLGSGQGSDPHARAVTRKRLTSITALVLGIAILLSFRLIYLQVVQADTLSETAREFRSRSSPLDATRGDIFDAHGAALATSLEPA